MPGLCLQTDVTSLGMRMVPEARVKMASTASFSPGVRKRDIFIGEESGPLSPGSVLAIITSPVPIFPNRWGAPGPDS